MFRVSSLLQHYSVNTLKAGSGNTPSALKITSWNVNGLRSVLRKNAIENLIDIDKPDILCLNETRIDVNSYNLTRIYNIIP
jgi:hypothetical protein